MNFCPSDKKEPPVWHRLHSQDVVVQDFAYSSQVCHFSSSQLIFLASVSLALSAFSTLGEEVSSQPREGISSVLQNKILIIVFVISFSLKINISKILLHSCLMTQD